MECIILGDGLLGRELVKQTGWDYVSRKTNNIDFTVPYTYMRFLYGYDTVINCIADTNTYADELENHWYTNYLGVISLVEHCNNNNKKLIHISTDHIYAGSVENAKETDIPVHARNWYSYTKLLSDAHVQAVCGRYLLIRTSFKPTPFPYPKAITTQTGNFDYVDVITDLIVKLIRKNACGVYNVGTDTKTIYDLALRTSNPVPWDGVIHPTMPTDVTMDISKMKEFLNEN